MGRKGLFYCNTASPLRETCLGRKTKFDYDEYFHKITMAAAINKIDATAGRFCLRLKIMIKDNTGIATRHANIGSDNNSKTAPATGYL